MSLRWPLAASRERELNVAMARLGVNQAWLFKQTAISKGVLSNICGGHMTQKAFAEKIASVLIAEHHRQFGLTRPAPTFDSMFEWVERPGMKRAA